MENPKERILLVESDPQVGEMIAKQTLRPLGYQVEIIESASKAIKEIEDIAPDLIITNLYLPEISGKDLLIALSSQGINVPMIVITPKGHESDALQAFKLGVNNFLTHPLREAEVVNVVEQTLSQYRKQRELEQYSHKLSLIKEELEERIRDLIDIFSIGKLVPSAMNQQSIYEKVVASAASISKADCAWVLVFDNNQKKYILRACQDVNEDMQSRLNMPYEDSLSTLIAVSGQPISIHGEALEPFMLADMVEAALIIPIKWKEDVIGMIATARKTAQAFTTDQQALLESLAEYVSFLIENSRRFQIMEQRLINLQQSSVYTMIDADLKNDLLQQASMELRDPLKSLMENLDALSNQYDRRLSVKQVDALNAIQEDADILMEIIDSMARIYQKNGVKILENIDLNELVREVVSRHQAIAQVCHITIKLELAAMRAPVMIFTAQITRVIEGLLSNALKYSPPKSQITLQVESKADLSTLSIRDQGPGIDENLVERLFEKKASLFGEEARRFGGIGISLPMIKEIISAHRGEIWIESGLGNGFNVTFSLPRSVNYSE